MSKLFLGPFIDVYRFKDRLLLFKPDPAYRSRIGEKVLEAGLKISPDKIVKAYKNYSGRMWIIVEFKRGYDLFKHFKLADRDKHAWRIPRIIVRVCPSCGGDVVENLCLDCGGEVEKPRHVEVWRDKEAYEKLIPVEKLKKEGGRIVIDTGSGEVSIPKHILYEKVVSIVRSSGSIYVKLLDFSRDENSC